MYAPIASESSPAKPGSRAIASKNLAAAICDAEVLCSSVKIVFVADDGPSEYDTSFVFMLLQVDFGVLDVTQVHE